MKTRSPFSTAVATALTAISLLGSPFTSAQAETATSSLGLHGSLGDYSNSQRRSSVSGLGGVYSYSLENRGVTLGLSKTRLEGQNGGQDLQQDGVFVSGYYRLAPNPGKGRYTLRLDLHRADNDDTTGVSDNVTSYAPSIAWTRSDNRLYLDLGYARSRYPFELRVNQWTPTLGMGFNDDYDWLTLRYWLIDVNDPALSPAESTTRAVEARWTHWLRPDNMLKAHNVRLGVIAGERQYAVDGDAGSVSNLSDKHRGGVNVGVEWRSGPSSLLLMLGHDRYRNDSLANDYTLNYAYLWYGRTW